jgi:uncharacterized protein (DUF2235 family)
VIGFGPMTSVQVHTVPMIEWPPGDNIFIFGFSRSAYTAQVIR